MRKRKINTGIIIGFIFVGIVVLMVMNRGERGYAPDAATFPGTAYSGNSEIGADAASSTSSSAVADNAVYAPDFTLTRLDGGTITLSDYRGKKPVVLDFWASWCPNCQRDMPKLSKMYDKYSDDVEVIGINLRESTSTAKKFVDSRNISFPIVMDKGRVSQQYAVRYTNMHVLINTDGTIKRIIPGDIKETDIIGLIEGK